MKTIIPIAGKDDRFERLGVFKPLIMIGDKPLIYHILKQNPASFGHLVFIVLNEHEKKFSVQKNLRNCFGNNITILIVDKPTQGAPNTILTAREFISGEEDILVELGDVLRDTVNLQTTIEQNRDKVAGMIPVDEKTLPKRLWGYVVCDEDGKVKKLREKEIEPSSKYATMGLYYFSSGSNFIWAAEQMIKNKSFLYNGTYYVGPVYNELVKRGDKIITAPCTIKAILGSPEEIENYRKEYSSESF